MTATFFKKFLPCSFTESALEEIKSIIRSKNIPADYGLRVGIKGGGCSGLSFLLGFDTRKETDDIFEIDGLKVFVEKKHAMYLANIQIDFEDGVNARGFVFNDQAGAPQ